MPCPTPGGPPGRDACAASWLVATPDVAVPSWTSSHGHRDRMEVRMGEDDAAARRRELTERAAYHADVQRRRGEEASAKAQVLIDRFVAHARETGLPTEELTARPWSGGGRYRTGLVGWFLRTNRSVGVDVDGRF